jgi:hypothetical protein
LKHDLSATTDGHYATGHLLGAQSRGHHRVDLLQMTTGDDDFPIMTIP